MRAPASTISAAQRRAAPANGARASASSPRPTCRRRRARCSRPISTPSRPSIPAPPDRSSGSPALLRHWLRAQDRMIACEAEPAAARALADRMRGDNRVRTVAIDGYTALNAYVPPKERRGLVLIDPPFEQPDE